MTNSTKSRFVAGVFTTPPLFIEEGDRRPNKKGVRWRSSVRVFTFLQLPHHSPTGYWGRWSPPSMNRGRVLKCQIAYFACENPVFPSKRESGRKYGIFSTKIQYILLTHNQISKTQQPKTANSRSRNL